MDFKKGPPPMSPFFSPSMKNILIHFVNEMTITQKVPPDLRPQWNHFSYILSSFEWSVVLFYGPKPFNFSYPQTHPQWIGLSTKWALIWPVALFFVTKTLPKITKNYLPIFQKRDPDQRLAS